MNQQDDLGYQFPQRDLQPEELCVRDHYFSSRGFCLEYSTPGVCAPLLLQSLKDTHAHEALSQPQPQPPPTLPPTWPIGIPSFLSTYFSLS